MPLCVLLDAHRQLVYACIFKRRGQIIKRHSSYLLTGMGELMSRLPSPCLFLGDGLLLYESMLRQQWKGEAHFAPQGLWIPRAGNLAVLAGKKLRQGRDFDPAGLKPLYLYPKECQVKS
jgi:tRNA A37 threonylcarbamoyladenosine modification protein TsaB